MTRSARRRNVGSARRRSFDAEIVNVAVAGNVVLTERVDHTEFQGAQYHARVMGAFEIGGDKITAWRDYFDMPNDGG